MKTKIGLLILWILGHFCNYLVAQPPHITGIVYISTEKETIECEFKYSDLPKYTGIMLFRGIGKPMLKDENGRKLKLKKADNLMWNLHYEFRNIDKSPSSFSVKYKYKNGLIFKAISDKKDWMGNMAFTDSSLRASWSTAWYPVLYDSASTVFHSEFTYDIRIVCKDCKTIFLNGSMPISGTDADFKSDIPVPLFLYAGNFEYRFNDGQLFVNSPFSPDMEELINKHIRSVENYYEEKLQIDYDSDISIVYAQPTNKKTSIYFISFPSIVALNMNKDFAVNSSNPNMLNLRFAQCLTHEIGHYYFGSIFFPNSTLFWAFLEGFTEYMTLKAYQSIFAPGLYDDDIKNKIEKIKDLNVIPLSEITDKEQINMVYRYKYVPLVLTAIEMEIGEENMWKWFNAILTKEKNVKTDYTFFRETLLEAVENENIVAKIENDYIKSEDAKQKIIDRLTDK